MILQAALDLIPALMPRQEGNGIFSIFNPQSHTLRGKQKKSIRTKITPQNFIQQGIANILQLNPYTQDNARRGIKCNQGYRGPQQQNRQVYVQVQNQDIIQKVIPVGHTICQLFASAVTNMTTSYQAHQDIQLRAQPSAMQIFLNKNTLISGNSQRIVQTSQPLPTLVGCVPVFNPVSIKNLSTILINMNPPQIAIKNDSPFQVQVAQQSYLGSVVWLQSVALSVTQSANTTKNKFSIYQS